MNMLTRTHTRNHRGGTVMVMVVVILVLMVMLGASYLQLARVQRVAPSQPINNIDLVLQSVIDEIRRQMDEDVRHNGTSFFVPDTSAEPFDYPYTNTAEDRDVPTLTGTIPGAKGGVNDDTWLADMVPYLNLNGSTLTLTWGKISTLTSGFYATTGEASPPVRNVATNATGSDPSALVTTEYDNIPVDSTVLVDADGDGIGDSRWERAPLMVLTGAEYFMAVRVIDASGLVNLLSATAQTPNGNVDYVPSTSGDVRGYYPTDVDLTRMLGRKVGGLVNGEVTSLFTTQRTNLPGTLPTPLGTLNPATFPATGSYSTSGVIGSWLEDVSIYGTMSGEASQILALQWRGGLKPNPSSASVDSAMTTMLNTPYNANVAEPIGDATAHYLGSTPSDMSTNQFASVRHIHTTLSGHSAFAPNHGNMHGGAHTLKQDLVYENASNQQARANAFYERLRRVFNLPATGAGDNAMAAQMALAMIEYSDADKQPSATIAVGGNSYYALEVLPFLREVYMQAGYEDLAPIDGIYTRVDDSEAMAIEIGNPFDRPFDHTGVEVQIVIKQGATERTIPINQSLNPRDPAGTTPDREHRIYVVNPGTGVDEGGVKNSLESDLAISPSPTNSIVVTTGVGQPFVADDSQVTVELQVRVAGGNWVAYDRLTDNNLKLPNAVDTSGYSGSGTYPQTSATGHLQKSLRRDGRVIRYIHNNGKGIINDRRYDSSSGTPWPDDGYSASACHTLNKDVKGVTNGSAAALDALQLAIANRPFFSVSELGLLMTVGFHNGATGGTFAELLEARSSNEWTLDISHGATKPLGAPYNQLTHAHIVMDQFTTISPRHDGVNNETGAADPSNTSADQFIPGTINANTAPPHVLAYAMPLPETQSQRGGLAAEMVAQRVSRDGFKSVGELLSINGSVNVAKMQFFGEDGNPQNGSLYDLYPMNEELGAAPFNAEEYATTDDNEEKLARFQFLAQSLTTRSDVFIAHILVKGYLSGDFAAGPVEQGRMIVVLSRAKLTGGGGGEVEVLAAYKY